MSRPAPRPWRNGEVRIFQWLNHGLSCPEGAAECEQRTDQHHDVYGRLIEWEGEAPAGKERTR